MADSSLRPVLAPSRWPPHAEMSPGARSSRSAVFRSWILPVAASGPGSTPVMAATRSVSCPGNREPLGHESPITSFRVAGLVESSLDRSGSGPAEPAGRMHSSWPATLEARPPRAESLRQARLQLVERPDLFERVDQQFVIDSRSLVKPSRSNLSQHDPPVDAAAWARRFSRPGRHPGCYRVGRCGFGDRRIDADVKLLGVVTASCTTGGPASRRCRSARPAEVRQARGATGSRRCVDATRRLADDCGGRLPTTPPAAVVLRPVAPSFA